MMVRIVGLAAFYATIAACSLPIPKQNETIVATTHDLGPPRAYAVPVTPPLAATLSIPAVAAPDWLDQGIVYRLLYEDASRIHAYTRSRWSADPASLLTERLRGRFVAVARGVVSPLDSARSDYTLRVELRDFSQSLESPSQSHVTVRARASLIASAERTLLAQREFEVRQPAAANAEGAVRALTEATDTFLDELAKWTEQSARR